MIYGDEKVKNTNYNEDKEYYIPYMNSIRQCSNLYVYCMGNPIRYDDYSGNNAAAVLEEGFKIATDISNSNPMFGPDDVIAGVVLAVYGIAAGGVAVYDAVTSDSDEKTTATTAEASKTATEERKQVRFPQSPMFFQPKGLTPINYDGTKNGKIIKWFDSNNKVVFEWDEDLKYGSHYHVGSQHDGTHYWPGNPVPEPYASIYF